MSFGRFRSPAVPALRRRWMELVLLAWLWLCPGALAAFVHSPAIGSAFADLEMPALEGGRQHLLTDALANVIVFVKPGQENSGRALKEIAELQKEFAGKSVHWVAVISDRIAKLDAEAAMNEAGVKMPVLIDDGDALYGRLEIALEPVTFFCDHEHKLAAYQPFTKANYGAVIQARVRHLLREINDEQLAAALNPPVATFSSETAAGIRRLKLAEMLLQAGSYEKALESVDRSIEKDPGLAAAWALRGDILLAQGKCSEAIPAFDQALKLDPQDARTLHGRTNCREKH